MMDQETVQTRVRDRSHSHHWRVLASVAAVCSLLAACGGGGGSDAPPPGPPPVLPPVLPPSATLAQQCSANNTLAPASARTGTLANEKRWIRSYVDEAYLWYNEVPTVDAAATAYSNESNVAGSLDNYFNALRTPQRTASNKAKDQFSFTFPTAEWRALSEGGVSAGFGIEWALGSPTPPRNIQVVLVEPGSPAAGAATRGMKLQSVNGVSADDQSQAGVNVLNEAVFGPVLGRSYNFVFTNSAGATVNASLTAGSITKTPVQSVRVLDQPGGARVGYMAFNDHIRPAEGQLVAAFTQFSQAGINDLVLDLRYNGGGFLYIASQVGYMIAGSQRTANRTFEKLAFNNKRTADNNDPGNNTPFINVTSGSTGSGTTGNGPLPQLNLSRVFILASPGSCSASESIVNGLRGVDVQVVLIGGTTCGKPFGFTAKDNCGVSYFPIEFQGTNAKGFGDYADGFAPTCAVADDLSRDLGDPNERMLASALGHRTSGSCPAAALGSAKPGAPELKLLRHPVRESKVLR
jgi:carboxyl-terminal processing protease